MQKFLYIIITIAVILGLFFGFWKLLGKSMSGYEGEGAAKPIAQFFKPVGEQESLEGKQTDQAEEIRKKQKMLMEERERDLRIHRSRY